MRRGVDPAFTANMETNCNNIDKQSTTDRFRSSQQQQPSEEAIWCFKGSRSKNSTGSLILSEFSSHPAIYSLLLYLRQGADLLTPVAEILQGPSSDWPSQSLLNTSEAYDIHGYSVAWEVAASVAAGDVREAEKELRQAMGLRGPGVRGTSDEVNRRGSCIEIVLVLL